MYDRNGDRVEARDVLDDEELRDYERSRRTRRTTGRTVPENTEEKALAAYERMVYGGGDR